jgi:uncharacterized protein YqeY
MSVKDQLNTALKEAMKNKDAERRNAIRLFTSAIKQYEVDNRKDANDDVVIDILTKEAKKRRESIDELEKAGRTEQAEGEKYELGILEEFLPAQLTEDEITAMAKEAIAQVGAETPKDMGKVMGALSAKTKGRADGKVVSGIVRDLLS